MSAATDLTALAAEIEDLYERATSDLGDEAAATVEEALALLDDGSVRVASPSDTGWHVHEWAKKAILLSFRTRGMQTIEVGPYEYHDKMPLKTGWAELGVRVVPPATVRQGAYVAPARWSTRGRPSGPARRSAPTCTCRAASGSAACSSPCRRAR
jgi:2,3,4,5-tetrahydropyridine-2,6-dicarboxylate N-succinyltransferase